MKDNIDFDASVVLTGEKTIDQRGEDLFNEMLEVANGKVTKAEAFGFMLYAENMQIYIMLVRSILTVI